MKALVTADEADAKEDSGKRIDDDAGYTTCFGTFRTWGHVRTNAIAYSLVNPAIKIQSPSSGSFKKPIKSSPIASNTLQDVSAGSCSAVVQSVSERTAQMSASARASVVMVEPSG